MSNLNTKREVLLTVTVKGDDALSPETIKQMFARALFPWGHVIAFGVTSDSANAPPPPPPPPPVAAPKEQPVKEQPKVEQRASVKQQGKTS